MVDEIEILRNYDKIMEQAQLSIDREIKTTLNRAQKIVGIKKMKSIKEYISDIGVVGAKIETLYNADGRWELEPYWFKGVYLRQYQTGEDSYHGSISIRLKNNIFLVLSFDE